MDAASFAISIIGLYNDVCRIWKTISEAKGFGDDIADFLARLEMQFFKYDMWWRYANKAIVTSQGPDLGTSLQTNTPTTLQEQQRYGSGKPIEDAAIATLKLLEDIQKVLEQYKILQIGTQIDQQQQQSLNNNHAARQVPISKLQESTIQAAMHHKALVASLQRKTPWHKRVLAGSAPWKTADKDKLEEKLAKFTAWNVNLYNLLPSEVRDSVLRQGLGAYLLESGEIDTKQINKLLQSRDECEREVGNSAHLLRMRHQFEGGQIDNPSLLAELNRRELDFFSLEVKEEEWGRSTGLYDTSTGSSEEVFVQWYDYQTYTPEEKDVAFQRLKQLSLLFGQPDKPTTLHVCESLGIIDDEDRLAFGLVMRYPSNARWPGLASSLHTLLVNKDRAPLPSLEQRRRLAQRIASAFFALMVLRWFHKNFNSHNIFFFADRQRNTDLENPYIFGFDIARPNRPKEVSINTALKKHVAIYHHPEVRGGAAARNGYHKKYEIFALGLTLAEIGFWKTADNLVPGAADLLADAFVQRLEEKCQAELGFLMGERYRDITLMCLAVQGDDVLAASLAEFYGSVVRDLIDRHV